MKRTAELELPDEKIYHAMTTTSTTKQGTLLKKKALTFVVRSPPGHTAPVRKPHKRKKRMGGLFRSSNAYTDRVQNNGGGRGAEQPSSTMNTMNTQFESMTMHPVRLEIKKKNTI